MNSRTIYQVITRHWLQLWYENGGWQEEIKWNIIVAPSPHLVSSGTALTICFVNSRTIYQVITRHWLQLWYENGCWQEDIKWNIIVAPSPHLVNSGTALTICFVNSRTIYQVITRHWLQLWYENGGWQEEIKWNIIVAPLPASGQFWNCPNHLFCEFQDNLSGDYKTSAPALIWEWGLARRNKMKYHCHPFPPSDQFWNCPNHLFCEFQDNLSGDYKTLAPALIWEWGLARRNKMKYYCCPLPTSGQFWNCPNHLFCEFQDNLSGDDKTLTPALIWEWGLARRNKMKYYCSPLPPSGQFCNCPNHLFCEFQDNLSGDYKTLAPALIWEWGVARRNKMKYYCCPLLPSGQFWNCPNHLFCEFQDNLSGDYKTLAPALIWERGLARRNKMKYYCRPFPPIWSILELP